MKSQSGCIYLPHVHLSAACGSSVCTTTDCVFTGSPFAVIRRSRVVFAIVKPEFADSRLTGCFNEKRTLFIWPRPLTVSAIRDVFGPTHPRSPRSPAAGSEQQKTVVLSIYSSDKHSSLRDVGNCRMKVDYFLVRPSSPLSHRQIVRAVSSLKTHRDEIKTATLH
jgi:hypothetical protein